MSDPAFLRDALAASPALHVVLEDWFNARGSDDPETVLRFFDPGFRIVSPAGKVMHRETFAAALPALRGSRPGLVMRITDCEVLHAGTDDALVTYIEQQVQGDSETRRRSTVLLVKAAHGLVWKHLQETWVG